MTGRAMSKALASRMEKHAEKVLTATLGPGAEGWSEYVTEWAFPYGDTGGTVTVSLIRESHETGPFTSRAPWLACRLRNPAHVGPDGYTLPRDAMPTRWPEVFTYPSGKCNLHAFRGTTFAEWERAVALHLYSIAAPGSPERHAFGTLEFESA